MRTADKIRPSQHPWHESDQIVVRPPLCRAMPGEPPGLSFAQQGLWALCQMESASRAYVIPIAWRLKGILDVGNLERSFAEIVRRHESLRTIFPVVDGAPVSQVTPSTAFKVESVDLQALPEEIREPEAQRAMDAILKQPMNITQGPLFRVLLIRLSPAEHILVMMIHHLIADGSSMGVMVSEIGIFYGAFCQSASPSLPDLPLQYADFVAWQRNLLTPELLDSQLSYWKRQLAGAPPLIQLPTDRPRPAISSFRGDIEHFDLSRKLTTRIINLSRQNGVTVFMVLCSALQVLLHRYSDSDDIICAWQTDGRDHHDLRGLVGYFVNPLVLRLNFAGEPTFFDILKSARTAMLQGYGRRETPFETIVKALKPERSPSYNPIFQVILAQQKASWMALKLAGIEPEFLPVSNGTAKCDLHFYITEGNDQLTGRLEFNTDIFDRQRIRRMIGHFHTLLTNAVEEPDRPVATLPLMSDTEMEQLVVSLNDTAAEYPMISIPQIFVSQAKKTPKNPAFLFANGSISYRELNSRANRLARMLVDFGVRRGMRVGVSMKRSLELPITLIAILKAGAAYVTLDIAYPEERLAYVAENAGIKLLICDSIPSWATKISGMKPILSRTVSDLGEKASDEDLAVSLDPNDAAYIIYTSGSTGQPKGVVASHGGTVNRLAWMWHTYPFKPGEVNSAKTSLNFVDSTSEMWGALLQGIPTLLVSDDAIRDPPRLIQALAASNVSRIILVPSLLRALLDTGDDLAARLPHLTFWMSSGEILPIALLKQFQRALPNRTLLNLYGSSEIAAGDATCYEVNESLDHVSVPIGRPIWNTQIYILDSARQLVPIGVPGEIYIGGVGLTSGYLNSPELTANKFVTNPFGSTGNSRLLRTGDRARYLADGNIEFLGRADNQIKVRGFRVELGEIEAWLARHSGVRQAAAVAFDDDISNKRIVAYVVPRLNIARDQPSIELACVADSAVHDSISSGFNEGTGGFVAELRAFLETHLPPHMLPSAFVLSDSLPLLPNGKVDRRALPDPGKCITLPEARYVAPRDVIEQQLADIWQNCLGIQQIGIHDDFFTLGGHSLLAVNVLRKVETILGKKMPLVMLLRAPTIEKFASALRSSGGSTPSVVAVQPKGTRPAFFCVYDRIDYGNLEGALGQDQPIYALPFEQTFDVQIKRDFLDVTREFVSRIRDIQREGPYYLGGMCLGGRIAFSIACELYRQGQTVGLLAVIDSPAPGYRSEIAAMSWKQRVRYHFLDEIEFEWETLQSLALPQKVAIIKETLTLDVARHWRRLKWRLTKRLYRLLGADTPADRRDSFHLMRETMGDYSPPERYTGEVILFRPEQRPGKCSRPEGMGWERFPIGALEIHTIPGRHIEMLRKPNVDTLGRILSESLKKAQSSARRNEMTG